MSWADTPTLSKKRDPSSPLTDLEQPGKKTKASTLRCDQDSDTDTDPEFEMADSGVTSVMECTEDKVVKMSLQESDLIRLCAMLKQVMAAEIKDLVKDVVTGVTEAVQEEVKQLKAELSLVREENDLLKARVYKLERGADDIEQYTRRNSVRVTGIPEVAGESTDALILDLSKDLDADLSLTDIDRSHRVGRPEHSKTRAIIVKFATYNARRKFMANRKVLKSKPTRNAVFINEDLTMQRNKLLYQARQLVKCKKLTGAWSVDGKIFVRTIDERKILILSDSELHPFRGSE